MLKSSGVQVKADLIDILYYNKDGNPRMFGLLV